MVINVDYIQVLLRVLYLGYPVIRHAPHILFIYAEKKNLW